MSSVSGGPPSRADEVGGESWQFIMAIHDGDDGLAFCE